MSSETARACLPTIDVVDSCGNRRTGSDRRTGERRRPRAETGGWTGCPTCGGSGSAPPPLWDAHHAWLAHWAATESRPTEPWALALWLDALAAAQLWWWAREGYGPSEWPPEQVECEECAGTGVVPLQVSMRDLLRLVARQRLDAGSVEEDRCYEEKDDARRCDDPAR
jgi:hypothetical protein